MNVLVTGGAGYVGSIVTEDLLRRGHHAVVLDNLQQGHRDAVAPEAEFVQAAIGDASALQKIFEDSKIEAVMHMAADTLVEFSMTDPKRYFRNNLADSITLLEAAQEHGITRFIFSSSAAVYGEPLRTPIDEEHPKTPVNSYGESKLLFERILDWYGRAYGMHHVSFRYFNAAGASARLGEDHRPETHLIPKVLRAALDAGQEIRVFGTDYPTPDGSCIRDYVHVRDIAQAHVLAMENLEGLKSHAFNLGNETGYSVLEVVEAARRVTGKDIIMQTDAARPGDPATLVAGSEKAKSELGWQPQFPGLEEIIRSAWEWTRQNPGGYEE